MNRVALTIVLAGSMILPPASASAAEFIYAATLSGANESPPSASPGTGFTTVTYNDLAHTLRVQTTFSDLTANTTASHIHVRAGDPLPLNGGVATQTPSFVGFPLGVTSGTFDNTFDLTLAASWNASFITGNGGTAAGAEAAFALALAEGRAYLNVHTSNFPAGEIRGDLAAVPEPATWGLLLLGFGLGGATLRRRPALTRSTVAA